MTCRFLLSLVSVFVLVGLVATKSTAQSKASLTWHLVLQVEPLPPYREATISETIGILKNRLDRLGVATFEVRPHGPEAKKQIEVSLSEVPDRNRLKRILTSMGRLELARIISPPNSAPTKTYKSELQAMRFVNASPDNRRAIKYLSEWVVVEVPSLIDGTELRTASPITAPGSGEYSVAFTLNSSGAKTLQAWTSANIGKYIAIILNNEVMTMPVIQSTISDSGEIAGKLSKELAQELAESLNGGPLPTRVRIIEERSN